MAASEESTYLGYLPAVLQEPPAGDRPSVLGRFLLAFEQVMTGRGDVDRPGLEELLDGIDGPVGDPGPLRGIERHFDPGPTAPDEQRAPAEFLDWLAGWVALSLRADLTDDQRRQLIARAGQLYRLRGTKQGLVGLLTIYLPGVGVGIEEMVPSLQVGVTSKVGVDTVLGGGAPHVFRLILNVPHPRPEFMRPRIELAKTIVDSEKPAHTVYSIEIVSEVLQIEDHSTVAVDTLLG